MFWGFCLLLHDTTIHTEGFSSRSGFGLFLQSVSLNLLVVWSRKNLDIYVLLRYELGFIKSVNGKIKHASRTLIVVVAVSGITNTQ